MSKDTTITIRASVSRYGKGDYRASLAGASAFAVDGSGSTEKEAREALARNLAWSSHMTEPCSVRDGEGACWLLYPGKIAGHWVARRFTGDATKPISSGSTIFGAANFSAAATAIAAWNAPQ